MKLDAKSFFEGAPLAVTEPTPFDHSGTVRERVTYNMNMACIVLDRIGLPREYRVYTVRYEGQSARMESPTAELIEIEIGIARELKREFARILSDIAVLWSVLDEDVREVRLRLTFMMRG